MSTITQVPADYPKEIIGYAEPWIASPGETIDIKISCTEPEYTYQVVRVTQGYEASNSPPRQTHVIEGISPGKHQGHFQVACPGSYAKCPQIAFETDDTAFVLDFHFQPWLVSKDHPQTLFSCTFDQSGKQLSIILDTSGELCVLVNSDKSLQAIRSRYRPLLERWCKLVLQVTSDDLRLDWTPVTQGIEPAPPAGHLAGALNHPLEMAGGLSLVLAATSNAHGGLPVSNLFNGRLDGVKASMRGQHDRVALHYDFFQQLSTDSIVDISGNNLHGTLINAPSRAVKGHDWDGSQNDWTKAKYGYGAIHFHEDDLDDACWETDFQIELPKDLRSGVYCVEIRSVSGDVADMVPFFVRPTKATTAKLGARTAMVMSTFTYLAYTNDHQWDPTTKARAEVPDDIESMPLYKDETFYKQTRRNDLGVSLYDVHRDGSAVMFTSAKRPLLNTRPDYVNWLGHRPRELSAELIMVGYLERLGIPYDIVTDHDLHFQGHAAIDAYDVLITGCHPEYPSMQSYQAYEDFLRTGGNLMYLGGNGFYWVSATDAARPHRMEVRRGGQGVRTSCQEPGERVMALTGSDGGLWRDCGRAANKLVGIGCCGEGAGPGVPYKQSISLRHENPELAKWIFAGMAEDELIGENTLGGLSGGASADELDRVDFGYGTPQNTILVATSTGHPDNFGLFPEDSGFPMKDTLGSQTDKIRSDITYFETSGGGAVFSVGSISWYVGLGWKDYQNNVAGLTKNVLCEFLRRGKGEAVASLRKHV